MFALIEKQQVRKRALRYGTVSVNYLPSLKPRPRSVAGQRWLISRETLPAPTEKVVPQYRQLVHERDSQSGRKTTWTARVLVRVTGTPLISSTVVLALLVALGAILWTLNREVAPLPRGGLSLPSDNQIDSALSEYGQTSEKVQPDMPVKIPNPSILETLKTSSYTMKSGDTISEIAKKSHVSVGTLISFNGITDVRRLVAGMKLKVPSMNGTLYRVKRGDTLGGIAKAQGIKLSNILDANAVKSSVIVPGQELFLPGAHMNSFAYRKALGTLFIWPTVGVITSPFGMRHDPFTGIVEFHNGIDIANVQGTPIEAAMDGRVAMVGRNRGYGNFIILNNGNGFQTLYGHLMKSLVKKGDSVRAGQEIGLMGDTGYATGPHLHFTIYKNSAPVNPFSYLRKR